MQQRGQFPSTHGSIGAKPRVQSNAESTAGKVFGLVGGICGAALVIMLTIKVGLVLFT